MLTQVSLSIPAGQRVLLAGPSGAGKSTLLRAMAGLLLTADQGDFSGQVLLDGDDVAETPGRVGLLQQDPLAGVVAETVGRDVAFGLENLSVQRDEIWRRVAGVLAATAFPYPSGHPTAALSGGETQRLALAGSLVLGAEVLLLDEPTSMLDVSSAQVVRDAVRRETVHRGTTLVVVEHHLGPWLDFADRLVVLGRGGRIVADGRPDEVLRRERTTLASEGVWVPGLPAPEPNRIDEGVVEPWPLEPFTSTGVSLGNTGGAAIVTASGIQVRRQAHLTGGRGTQIIALDDVDAALHRGRTLGVTGASGSGKSTLIAVLAGLLEPNAGDVMCAEHLGPLRRRRREPRPWKWRSAELAARLAWVPQMAESGVVSSTVFDEVMATSRAVGRGEGSDVARTHRRADAILETLGLSHLRDTSPYHLSGGEQRRLMVAAALVHGPHGLLLDEPTVGQDRATWAAVVGCIASAQSAGAAVGLASHDLEAVTALDADPLRLEHGRIG